MSKEKTPSWPNDNETYHLGSLERKILEGHTLSISERAFLLFMYTISGNSVSGWRKVQLMRRLNTQEDT